MFLDSTPLDVWKNTVLGVLNGIEEHPFSHFRDAGVYKFYVGWHLAGPALLVVFIRQQGSLRFLGIALLLSLLYGAITSFKSGSGTHYLFEFHLFVMVGCAVWLARNHGSIHRMLIILFLTYGFLFMLHRTRQLEAWVGTGEERAHSYAECLADIQVYDVLLNELALRNTDKVYMDYRGHLELLLNGQGLLAQKDIASWSTEPPFDMHRFHEIMTDGTVRFIISRDRGNAVEEAGSDPAMYVRVREVDGLSIWAVRKDVHAPHIQ